MKISIEIQCGDLQELLAHLSIIRSGLKKKVAANWDTDKDFTFEDANCYGDHQVAVEFLPNKKEKVDWQEALKYLKEIRSNYIEIGTSGLLALGISIDPLIARFESGERSRDLYASIMALQ